MEYTPNTSKNGFSCTRLKCVLTLIDDNSWFVIKWNIKIFSDTVSEAKVKFITSTSINGYSFICVKCVLINCWLSFIYKMKDSSIFYVSYTASNAEIKFITTEKQTDTADLSEIHLEIVNYSWSVSERLKHFYSLWYRIWCRG